VARWLQEFDDIRDEAAVRWCRRFGGWLRYKTGYIINAYYMFALFIYPTGLPKTQLGSIWKPRTQLRTPPLSPKPSPSWVWHMFVAGRARWVLGLFDRTVQPSRSHIQTGHQLPVTWLHSNRCGNLSSHVIGQCILMHSTPNGRRVAVSLYPR
jgi:hypothetical protein